MRILALTLEPLISEVPHLLPVAILLQGNLLRILPFRGVEFAVGNSRRRPILREHVLEAHFRKILDEIFHLQMPELRISVIIRIFLIDTELGALFSVDRTLLGE